MYCKIKREFCLNGHRRTPDNLYKSGNCAMCNKEQVKNRYKTDPVFKAKKLERSRIYQKSEKWKDSMLRRDYGISLIDYKRMLQEQNSACAICFTHESNLNRPLNVDHNHKTNKVRKLLCCNCNTALGLLKEDCEVIKRLVAYVEN